MAESQRPWSRLSSRIKHTAFVTYFLGAIVPLVALGLVLDRFVLPRVEDPRATLGLIGGLVSIAVLSLLSFLALRRSTRHSLERVDRENQRLASLLKASWALARAEHGGMAGIAASACAMDLTDSSAAWVAIRPEPGQPFHVLGSAGEDAAKWIDALREPLHELVELAIGQRRPAVHGPGAVATSEGELTLSAAVAPLPGQAGPTGALVSLRSNPAQAFGAGELDALSTLAALLAVSLNNADLKDAQRNFFTHLTDILVQALDSHLDFHAGHGRRVAEYANLIARELGLDEQRRERLHFAALLHDIGMLKIDRNQQMNARTCAKHTVLGYRMLDRIRLWKDVAPLVHHHHERWDGTGYPEGLAGEAIPLEARIVALAEAFDTMTSPTSYKPARSLADAAREIEVGAGTQFDPTVANAFLRLFEAGKIPACPPG